MEQLGTRKIAVRDDSAFQGTVFQYGFLEHSTLCGDASCCAVIEGGAGEIRTVQLRLVEICATDKGAGEQGTVQATVAQIQISKFTAGKIRLCAAFIVELEGMPGAHKVSLLLTDAGALFFFCRYIFRLQPQDEFFITLIHIRKFRTFLQHSCQKLRFKHFRP